MKFNVGDTVKIIMKGFHFYNKVSKIISINNFYSLYYIHLNGTLYAFYEYELVSAEHYNTPLGKILYK